MRTAARRASAALAATPEPEFRPGQAWPGMPPPAPPITLSDPDLPLLPEPPAPRLDAGTLREAFAVLFLLCGATAATIGGFLLSPAIGLFVLGGLLLVLGVLLGVTS